MSLYAILKSNLTFDRWINEDYSNIRPGRYLSGIDTGIPNFVTGIQKIVEGNPVLISGYAYKVYNIVNLNSSEVLIYNTPNQTGLYVDILKLTSGINLVSGQRLSGDFGTGNVLGGRVASLSGFTLNLSGDLVNTISSLSGFANNISTNAINNSTNLSGNILITGSNLYNIITGISGNTSTLIYNTGQLNNNNSNNNAANLSGNLTQTGIRLSALKVTGSNTINNANITGINGVSIVYSAEQIFISGNSVSAGVSNINSLTNSINLVGTGSISVTTNAQNIIISGSSSAGISVSDAYASDNNISGNLFATGANQYILLTGLSGQNNINYATIVNLTQTGVLLNSQIDNLSGFSTSFSGFLQSQITSLPTSTTIINTGSTLYVLITGLSGQLNSNYATIVNLTQTGVSLGAQINSLSGFSIGLSGNLQGQINFLATSNNLGLTGSNLYGLLTGSSGNSNLNLASTGQQAWFAANANSVNLSGNLGITGSNLFNVITGFSGQSNTNYATISNLGLTGVSLYINLTGLSGVFVSQIANSGQQSWIVANNNSINISGNLAQTGILLSNRDLLVSGTLSTGIANSGSILDNKINSLSGFTLNVSGALQALLVAGGSSVKITGSAALPEANFSGLGSVSVTRNNNIVLISGSSSQGGSTSPGGASGQVQYNENGSFNGATSIFIHDGDLTLQRKDSIPSTPPPGHMKLFARSIAGGYLPAFIGPSNVDSSLQPLFARNSIGYWKPIGNSTTLPLADGIVAPTTTGTATARNVATTNFFTSLRRIGYVSAATAGAAAGARSNVLQFWRGNTSGAGGFRFITRFGISDAAAVAGSRMFVGLIGLATPINASQTVAAQINIVGIGHEAGDSTFRIYYNDGTSTASIIDLGSNFPCTGRSTDAYELALFAPPNASFINYQVTKLNPDITTTGTLTTDIPASTQLLAPQLWRGNGATTLAVGLDLISLYIETDY